MMLSCEMIYLFQNNLTNLDPFSEMVLDSFSSFERETHKVLYLNKYDAYFR